MGPAAADLQLLWTPEFKHWLQGLAGQLYQTIYLSAQQTVYLSAQQTVYLSPLKREKRSTGEKPRNVSRFMLTEPRKYSSCNTENQPRNIYSYFSNCF